MEGCWSSTGHSRRLRTVATSATGSDPVRSRCPACAGDEFIHVAVLRHDVADFGLTDDDREQMGRYLSEPYLDRTPDDLRPDDLRPDDGEGDEG